jgi:hypothetical protein
VIFGFRAAETMVWSARDASLSSLTRVRAGRRAEEEGAAETSPYKGQKHQPERIDAYERLDGRYVGMAMQPSP